MMLRARFDGWVNLGVVSLLSRVLVANGHLVADTSRAGGFVRAGRHLHNRR
jgi:hypothetical protein